MVSFPNQCSYKVSHTAEEWQKERELTLSFEPNKDNSAQKTAAAYVSKEDRGSRHVRMNVAPVDTRKFQMRIENTLTNGDTVVSDFQDSVCDVFPITTLSHPNFSSWEGPQKKLQSNLYEIELANWFENFSSSPAEAFKFSAAPSGEQIFLQRPWIEVSENFSDASQDLTPGKFTTGFHVSTTTAMRPGTRQPGHSAQFSCDGLISPDKQRLIPRLGGADVRKANGGIAIVVEGINIWNLFKCAATDGQKSETFAASYLIPDPKQQDITRAFLSKFPEETSKDLFLTACGITSEPVPDDVILVSSQNENAPLGAIYTCLRAYVAPLTGGFPFERYWSGLTAVFTQESGYSNFNFSSYREYDPVLAVTKKP